MSGEYCTCPRKPGDCIVVDSIENPVCPDCDKSLDCRGVLDHKGETMMFTPDSVWTTKSRGETMNGLYKDITEENEMISTGWAIIKTAVRTAIGNDKPAIFLSGGLDSGLIAAACVELGHKPVAYTVCFGADDEDYINARATARMLGLFNKATTMLPSMLPLIREGLYKCMGKPPVEGAEQIWFAYEMLRRNKVKVVLGGNGGDETFGGYPWQYDVPKGQERDKMELLKHTNLYPLLYVENKIADYFGVELRTPFTDGIVNEFAKRLPLHALYDKDSDLKEAKGGKVLLRKIAQGKLPDSVCSMKKRGYVLPKGWAE